MGLFDGNASVRRFKVKEDLPLRFQEIFEERIKHYRFKEKWKNDENQEEKWGWVNPRDILDLTLTTDRYLYSNYLVLGLRVDRRVVPAFLFKAHLRRSIETYRQQVKKDKISPYELDQIKAQLRHQLLLEISPRIAVYEFSWNLSTNHVFLTNTSKKITELFCQAFLRTFDMNLIWMDFPQIIQLNGLDWQAAQNDNYGQKNNLKVLIRSGQAPSGEDQIVKPLGELEQNYLEGISDSDLL